MEVDYLDGGKTIYGFSTPDSASGFISGPDSMRIIDASGNITTVTHGDTQDTIVTPTTPVDQPWTYGHASGSQLIAAIGAPDGTYTDLAYTAAGQLQEVDVYDANTVLASSTAYTYSGQQLASVAKGNKEAAYTYSTDSSGNQSVQTVEQSAGLLQTRYTRTVYYYGIDGSTTVTRKKNLTDLIDDPADEATTYTFHVDSYTGMKQYVNTVTGPTGTHTTYDIAYFSGPEGGEPYAVTVRDSGANFLQQTNYTYDGNTGALLGVEGVDSSGNPLSMDSSAYYTNSAGSTVWLESHEDTRESWTHYIRDPSNMADVLAVQTAGPGLSTEPQWVDSGANYLIAPIKDDTYYTPTDSAGGLPGQVKTETVPGVGWIGGNQVAYVDSTGYVYVDSAGYHDSPTQTTYHYTDGGAKTNTTAYDALDRVLSATDANGRTISYTYDALGRQVTTSYGNGIGTQNQYSCCTLEWSRDENGHTTYYDYDDDNRVMEPIPTSGRSEQPTPGHLLL